jgi:nitrate/TMAO reductase-like tetraheme cytochrome c subunit
MKKTLLYILIITIFTLGYFIYNSVSKIFPFYKQLTKERVGSHINLQNQDQENAHFVGAKQCLKCHKNKYKEWSHSGHPRMINDFRKNPSVVVADFSKLPADANFKLEDATYTIGSKFKQRFMIRKDFENKEDYILGNYQWNSQTNQWQSYKPWADWYKDAFAHNNEGLPTSKACDGCHFTGFMSTQKRVDTGISCESCHGPASKHVQNPNSKIYLASLTDPVRQNEICLACHMRNRDKRMQDQNISELFGDVRDYPFGYEAGKPLSEFKLVAPFVLGKETKEFYANGMGKKNRMQGNEFVHSMKAKHGITCINCHNPHTLEPTAQKNSGNASCMKCHSFGSVIGPHQKDISAHTKHKADSKGSSCVECHMPKVGKHTSKSPLSVRTHIFGFITPNETLKYNMPNKTNACFSCHEDRGMKTLQKDMEKWGMITWDKR